jgi:hypothetical protein
MRGNAPLVAGVPDPTLRLPRLGSSKAITLMVDDSDLPERPRAEPEIIPPGQSGRRPGQPAWPPAWGPYGAGQARGAQRIYVMRPGPLGFAVLMLALALIVALVLLILVGTFLLWIPVIALLVVVGAIYRFLRR